MFGSDFIVIKDHRGYKAGFFWSDVQQVIGNYSRAAEVKVKFKNDHEGTYTLIFAIHLNEFFEKVKDQLNHPPKLYQDDEEFLSSAHSELLTFNIDDTKVKLLREDIWRARQTCTGSCDLTSYCPFFGKPNIEVGAGCRRIFDAYDAGQYTVSNGFFKEVDE